MAFASALVDWSKLVTSARDGAGDLDLLAWTIQADGDIRLGGVAEFGAIADASVHAMYSHDDRIVALVDDGNDDMRLQSFDENFALGL